MDRLCKDSIQITIQCMPRAGLCYHQMHHFLSPLEVAVGRSVKVWAFDELVDKVGPSLPCARYRRACHESATDAGGLC